MVSQEKYLVKDYYEIIWQSVIVGCSINTKSFLNTVTKHKILTLEKIVFVHDKKIYRYH